MLHLLLLLKIRGLNPPGQTTLALLLPRPRHGGPGERTLHPAGPCLPAACVWAAGFTPFQPPPPGAGGSRAARPPGRCRFAASRRAAASCASGVPGLPSRGVPVLPGSHGSLTGAVGGSGDVVWLIALAIFRCRILLFYFIFYWHHLTCGDLSKTPDVKNTTSHPTILMYQISERRKKHK